MDGTEEQKIMFMNMENTNCGLTDSLGEITTQTNMLEDSIDRLYKTIKRWEMLNWKHSRYTKGRK